MRTVLLLAVLSLCLQTADARSLTACTASWRLGNQLVRAGDSVNRALNAIDRASARVRWLKGPRGDHWSLIEKGLNARTVSIRIRGGRIDKLCQYSG